MPKEQPMLQGMIHMLIEVGRCYGMEMNVNTKKVMRISRELSSLKIMKMKNNWKMWNISLTLAA
jgi:hypothetical protein